MSISYNTLRVRIHLSRLADNYRLLARQGGNAVAVVKADAYGHGLAETARVLAGAGATTLAVGTVEEALFARRLPYDGRVLSLLGPLGPADYPLLWEGRIIPFVGSFEQIGELGRQAESRGALDVALKFDTGMARLGFEPDDLPALLDALRARPALRPVLACSHLASADEPEAQAVTDRQAALFADMLAGLRAAGLAVEGCLANSAALLARPDLRHEAQRPGIALYGVNPFRGTAWEHLGAGLRPAMEVTTVAAAVHDLRQGRSISYGGTFTAPRDMRVAIVAAGYADGYSRSLSNRGQVLIRGRRAPIAGRVCMQLTAVDVTDIPGVQAGEEVTLLGGQGEAAISPEELAGWWGTIPYEVLCLLGLNRREYVRP